MAELPLKISKVLIRLALPFLWLPHPFSNTPKVPLKEFAYYAQRWNKSKNHGLSRDLCFYLAMNKLEIMKLSPLSECILRKPSSELYALFQRPKSFEGWGGRSGLWRAGRNFDCDQTWSSSHNIHTVPSLIPFKP